MKLLIVNPQNIATNFDNKKTEIKRYMDNLDFEQTESKEINVLKRVALLMLNNEEASIVTLDYKNEQIEYKSNVDFLIMAKLTGKTEIIIKVLSNEDKFMEKYEARQNNLKINAGFSGFINWQEKNNISENDWTNIDFLKERIDLSSFEDVLSELIKKKNLIYLSKDFIIELVKNSNQEIAKCYFSKLTNAELKNKEIIDSIKEDYNQYFFSDYFLKVLEDTNINDKELTEIIKTQIINKENIKDIFHKKNIAQKYQYIPNALRADSYIIACMTDNIKTNNYVSSDKLSFDQIVKIIGKKYLMNKANFTFFINEIKNIPFRTNDATDKVLNEVVAQFDLKNEQDKKYFNFLCDENEYNNEYKMSGGIIRLIIKKNESNLDDKEKINLYSKGLLQLEKKEVLALTKTEEDIELFLKGYNAVNSGVNCQIVREKIKTHDDMKHFIKKRENIISFIKIALNDNWLKSNLALEEWKKDNTIIIETYGKSQYKELSLEKRKKLEENKDNVTNIIKMNPDNFNIVRNENKYDLTILRELAENNPENFKNIIENIPAKKWFNFNFSLRLIDFHPNSLEYIPAILFDNKQFTLSIFEKYENHNAYPMKDLLSKIPEELKSFLQDNKMSSNYVETLNKHFIKDYLEISLINKNDKPKKIKI